MFVGMKHEPTAISEFNKTRADTSRAETSLKTPAVEEINPLEQEI